MTRLLRGVLWPFWLVYFLLVKLPLTVITGEYYIYRQIARTFRRREIGHLVSYALRISKFGAVGLFVAVLGFGIQYAMRNYTPIPETVRIFLPVDGLWVDSFVIKPIFILEGALSVQLSFILNRNITWRDRRVMKWWQSWWRYNAARSFTYTFDNFLYAPILIEVFGQSNFITKVATIIVGAAFNYTAADIYAFAPGQRLPQSEFDTHRLQVTKARKIVRGQLREQRLALAYVPNKVSVIVVCRNNQDTIGEVVRGLFAQSYNRPGRNLEFILIGSKNDQTWQGIPREFLRHPLQIWEMEVRSPGRDTNAKRMAAGVEIAEGDIVIYIDADTVTTNRPDWLNNYVAILSRHEAESVGGPLVGIPTPGLTGWKAFRERFWIHFIDKSATGSKTPRMPARLRLTMDNLVGHKPPVTANWGVDASVLSTLNAGGPPPEMVYSLEDYAWAQAQLDAGYSIVLDPRVEADRYHRVGFRKLVGEYVRSPKGVVQLGGWKPHSPFVVYRLAQFATIPWVLAATAVAGWWFPAETLVVAVSVVLALVLTNLLAAKRLAGALYPFIGGIFSLCYIYGGLDGARRLKFRRPVRPYSGNPYQIFPPTSSSSGTRPRHASR